MGKRNSIISLSVFILLLSFIACDNQNKGTKSNENGLVFDTLIVEKTHFLDNDKANPSCNIHIRFEYPKESNKMDVADLQQLFIQAMLGVSFDSLSPSKAVDSYIANYISNYQLDASIYKNNITELSEMETEEGHYYIEDDDNLEKPKVFYSYFETISDSIVYDKRNILSFQVKQTNFKDDSESYNVYRNYVVNLKTGVLLSENDLFIPGYEAALQRLLISALLDLNNVENISDLEDLGYFGIDEIMPNKNFLVVEKGIIYTFNRGEYSAYQLRAPMVFIPFNQMTALLKENTVVSKLAAI